MIYAEMIADGSPDGLLGVRSPAAVASAQVHEAAEGRLWDGYSDTMNPWRAGHDLAAKRFGLAVEHVAAGVAQLDGVYARVETSPEHPGGFRLAAARDRAAGVPAALFRYESADAERDDLLALSLKPESRRFWRLTRRCGWIGEGSVDPSGVLRLRQEAHVYFAALIKAAAYDRQGRQEGVAAFEEIIERTQRQTGLAKFVEAKALPADDGRRVAYLRGLQEAMRRKDEAQARWRLAATPPGGTLILDPTMVDWTRRGALAEAEWVEILDAPIDGPLGRAIQKLNPRVGTKDGVRLSGLETPKTTGRRAA